MVQHMKKRSCLNASTYIFRSPENVSSESKQKMLLVASICKCVKLLLKCDLFISSLPPKEFFPTLEKHQIVNGPHCNTNSICVACRCLLNNTITPLEIEGGDYPAVLQQEISKYALGSAVH